MSGKTCFLVFAFHALCCVAASSSTTATEDYQECDPDSKESCAQEASVSLLQRDFAVMESQKLGDKDYQETQMEKRMEQKEKQMEQKDHELLGWQAKMDLLTQQIHNSEVEDSVIDNTTLVGVLQLMRNMQQSSLETSSRGPSNLYTGTVDLFKETYPDAASFETDVAAKGNVLMATFYSGDEPDWQPIVDLGLETLNNFNPILGFFAELLMGMLAPEENPHEALIKHILDEVDKKVNQAKLEALSSELRDASEELAWLPNMLGCEGTAGKHACEDELASSALHQTRVSYFLMVQHSLALQRTYVFRPKCIEKKPWEIPHQLLSLVQVGPGMTPPRLLEETSMEQTFSRKGGGGSSQGEGCDIWNQNGKIHEVVYAFTNTQLSVLATIVQLNPTFKESVAERVEKISLEYAGLIHQGYEIWMAHRIREVNGMLGEWHDNYHNAQHRWQSNGYIDYYLGGKECKKKMCNQQGDWCKTPCPHNCVGDCQIAAYKTHITTQLANERKARVDSVLCYWRAAAVHFGKTVPSATKLSCPLSCPTGGWQSVHWPEINAYLCCNRGGEMRTLGDCVRGQGLPSVACNPNAETSLRYPGLMMGGVAIDQCVGGESDYTYTVHTKKHCYGNTIGAAYGSLAAAKTACQGDDGTTIGTACTGVYDQGCDNAGTFFMCGAAAKWKDSISKGLHPPSCVHEPHKVEKGCTDDTGAQWTCNVLVNTFDNGNGCTNSQKLDYNGGGQIWKTTAEICCATCRAKVWKE